MASLFSNAHIVAAGRLFSAAVIQEMTRSGKSPLFARLAKQSNLANMISPSHRVSNAFDAAFDLLKKKANRYEYVYKSAIAHKILIGVHSLKTATMLSEFRVGACKADLVILNGTSTVYEIKSERDNLERLENQISMYRKVFSRVNIITGESHVDAVLGKAPAEVGVLLLTDRFSISTVREAQSRPDLIEPAMIFESLHKHEAIRILQELDLTVPDVPNTKFHAAMVEIFSSLDSVAVHTCMLKILKENRSSISLAQLVAALPKSLYAVALSTPMRITDQANLLSAVNTPLTEALEWV